MGQKQDSANPSNSKDPGQYSKMDLNAKRVASTPSEPVLHLLTVGKSIVTDPEHQPHDGLTFCNFAVSSAAIDFNYDGFLNKHDAEPLMANDIINVMAKSEHWKAATASEAWDHALQGGLAIACYSETPHGHVAVVAPGPRVWSVKWSSYVPPVFNVGKADGMNLKSPYTVGENFAFALRPNHYVYLS